MINQPLTPASGAVLPQESARHIYHFEQDQPEKLCVDRELKTPEIHTSNDFYGQASVLKRYAGLPSWYPLKAVLEHAPVVQDDMWKHDRNALLPVNLSCTESRAHHMQEVSGKLSFPVGFGFLYAASLVDAMYGPPQPPEQRRLRTPARGTAVVHAADHHLHLLERLPERRSS